MPIPRSLLMLALLAALPGAGVAQTIPIVAGLTIVETEHSANLDRESLVTLESVSPTEVRYVWRHTDVRNSRDTVESRSDIIVASADLAAAPRVRLDHPAGGTTRHAGYTAFSLSTATYLRVAATGSDTFQVMHLEPAAAISFVPGVRAEVPVRWRGTLTRIGRATFPLIVGGRRVSVPALRLRGEFTAPKRRWNTEIWVLADSAHPLFLKWIGRAAWPEVVLQTVRVDLPTTDRAIEGELEAKCRVEVPGVYFATNSAAIDPASDRALAAVAATLARHSDWTVTIEGHTDSIGTIAANQSLSKRRAAAVRDRLVSRHGVTASRLGAVGFGPSTPRESNATIEGRARNRRVELVRPCSVRQGGGTP